MWVCMRGHVCVYTCALRRMYMHAYECVEIYRYTHTRVHTHTQKDL